jgi:hypothetical protein
MEALGRTGHASDSIRLGWLRCKHASISEELLYCCTLILSLQTYREDLKNIAGQINGTAGCDPEVQLAVRLADSSDSPGADATQEGIDDFCSSHGFEYVDATRSVKSDAELDEDAGQ